MPTLTGKGIHTRFLDVWVFDKARVGSEPYELYKIISFLKNEQKNKVLEEMKKNLEQPKQYKKKLARGKGWKLGNMLSFTDSELADATKKTYISQMKSVLNKEQKFKEAFGITYSEITPKFIEKEVYNKNFDFYNTEDGQKPHPFRGEHIHRLYSTTLKRLYVYMQLL